jgi:anthranilate synthase component 1|tara:strand:- start:3382 stop:5274 length:1893 start_codon:yes stop_codon:yes gene_type:complete
MEALSSASSSTLLNNAARRFETASKNVSSSSYSHKNQSSFSLQNHQSRGDVRARGGGGRGGRFVTRNHLSSRRTSVNAAAAAAAQKEQTNNASSNDDDAFELDRKNTFLSAVEKDKANVVPVFRRIFDDQLTPILAYRLLVKDDAREAPSFLFESVVGGTQIGRYSFLGRRPKVEVLASENRVRIMNHAKPEENKEDYFEEDPMTVMAKLGEHWKPAKHPDLPDAFAGGWVGFAGYDTVRYQYINKLPFDNVREQDDRDLPDVHMGLYEEVIVFDHATKQVYGVKWVMLEDYTSKDGTVDAEKAYSEGIKGLDDLMKELQPETMGTIPFGSVDMRLSGKPEPMKDSNMSKESFLDAVATTKEHIKAGDIFQLVLSHRFERKTKVDPFEVYRALRVVNPSPYMIYYQGKDCILIASSPEILCRVDDSRTVVNRPLAGTRARGKTQAEDLALEEDLLADEKERAEHVMLVDLGRNDVGRVSQMGTVKVEKLMEIERYSHVMHISSTVTGKLIEDLNPWDVLRAALPVGTVSGAPKVRAMQIIDDLEVSKRGPYGGGIGYVGFAGEMDIALALRTMVVPTKQKKGDEWTIHVQAGAGIVADSNPESEYQETVNKSAALGRSIDLAERAFLKKK